MRWSAAAAIPRPGEISLAHHGVLFLDELPEWNRRVLEVLREPLESGVIHISRAARQSTLPCRFPVHRRDESLPLRLARTREPALSLHAGSDRPLSQRISGPLIDRIDLGIEVPALTAETLALGARAAR